MRQHMMIGALGLALAAGGCATAASPGAKTQLAGAQCSTLSNADQHIAALYAPGHVDRVEPVYRTQFFARSTVVRYVSGAKLYVPAQEGVTQAYLERVLTCHAASSASQHENDPLRVANVRDVDVASQGQRFVIQIEGADRASGKTIFERAQALHRPSGSVEVRQLSAAPTSGARL